MRRLHALCLVPVALALMSCAPSLIPVSIPDGIADVEAGSLTLTKEGITITVYADAWRYDPIDVDDVFTPFLIAVSNNTDQDIVLQEDSILMYDANNVQYGVVPAESVDRATVPSYGYPPRVYWGMGYGVHSGWGGWAPNPRKPSAAACSTAVPMPSVA